MYCKKSFVLSTAFLASAFVAWPLAAEASSDESDDPKWCRACHDTERFSAETISASVHSDLACRDCHSGYHFNPHEAVDEGEATANADLAERVADPGALAACSECHADVADESGFVAHGDGKKETAAHRPLCMDCHGDPHRIRSASDFAPGVRRRMMNERCITCHDDEDRMAAAGLHIEPVEAYEESMHSRKLALGSDRAPGCVDCHGGHEQTDMTVGLTDTCKKCHSSANAVFASLATHAPLTPSARPVGYYTQKFFAWLTFLVILLLAIHIALDLAATLRNAPRKREA